MIHKLKSRKNINKKKITITILIISLLFVSIGFSYIETLTQIIGKFTTTDNLNNCYAVEVLGQQMSACLDNKKSKYVTSNTGINFSQGGSNTNGKGLYIMSSTKDDSNPVYYYRGDINNNNVLFANRCWKIVRTTETGGTKLIYNGVPNESGSCNNTGTASQLGKVAYNSQSSNAALASVGYMYTGNYYMINKQMSAAGTYDSSYSHYQAIYLKNQYITSYDYNYYYSSSYTYENGTFSLGGDAHKYGQWSTAWEKLKNGFYTCLSSSSTTCSSLRYVYDGTETQMKYVDVTPPKLIESTTSKGETTTTSEPRYEMFDPNNIASLEKHIKSMTSFNYYYSKSYTYENGKYVLTDARKMGDLIDIYDNISGYYTCDSTSSSSCSTLYYVISSTLNGSNYIYSYLLPLVSGRTLEEQNASIYMSSNIKKNDDNTYSLVDPIEIKRVDWYKNMRDNVGYYICPKSSETTCENMEVVAQTYTQYYDYLPNEIYTFSKEISWDGTKYNLSGETVTLSSSDFVKNKRAVGTYHYTCLDDSISCVKAYYQPGDISTTSANFYYFTLENGVTDVYNAMFANDNSRNENDSLIKNFIDSNLFEAEEGLSNWADYLEDTIWCNERTLKDLKGLDISKSGYAWQYKMYSNYSPILTCENVYDRFTVSEASGNGKLKYPVGLITMNESILAGSNTSSTYKSYLYSGQEYWLMTPQQANILPYQYFIDDDNTLYYGAIYSARGVRPAISLKSGITASSGDGSASKPYVIS